MKNSFRTFALIAGLAAVAAPAAAVEPKAVDLTYPAVLTIIGTTHGEIKATTKAIVGKTLRVKLIATGPDALMANKKDGVYFRCDKRSPAFKGGMITAKITKFEDAEGDVSISLDKCGA